MRLYESICGKIICKKWPFHLRTTAIWMHILSSEEIEIISIWIKRWLSMRCRLSWQYEAKQPSDILYWTPMHSDPNLAYMLIPGNKGTVFLYPALTYYRPRKVEARDASKLVILLDLDSSISNNWRSAAPEMPVKFQSDTTIITIITSNRLASSVHDIGQ